MHWRKTIGRVLVCLAVCTSASLADAQSPARHAGPVASAGPYRLELYTAHNEIAVYVTDQSGAEISTAGGKGRAMLHTAGRRTSIDLKPIAPNILGGRGRYTLSRTSVVYVTVDLKHEHAHRAVFRPLAQDPPRPAQQ